MTYFEYEKTEKVYETSEHLLNQIIKNALLIALALYLRYKLLFIFDHATSHSIYAKDVLQVT